jgi:hypothetical protein
MCCPFAHHGQRYRPDGGEILENGDMDDGVSWLERGRGWEKAPNTQLQDLARRLVPPKNARDMPGLRHPAKTKKRIRVCHIKIDMPTVIASKPLQDQAFRRKTTQRDSVNQ